jgi:lipopolysaccharide biosynthesis glycosyltransferase
LSVNFEKKPRENGGEFTRTIENAANEFHKNNGENISEEARDDDMVGTKSIRANIKSRETIPVAYGADEGFAFQTIVSITSLCESARDDIFLEIFIMVPGDMSAATREKFLGPGARYKNCSIEIIDMGDDFKDVPKGWWGKAGCYRLKLPSLLPNHKKCVYLDGDTLILHDLGEFFKTNISDYYAAGVLDSCHFGRKRIREAGMFDEYINSGVLLMNLEKMREDDIERKFLEIIAEDEEKHFLRSFDQDAINEICYGKILFIPFKFNCMHYYTNLYAYDKNHGFLKAYPEAEIIEAEKNPVILHLTMWKPWQNTLIQNPIYKNHKLWWRYAAKTPHFNEIVKMCAGCAEKAQMEIIERMIDENRAESLAARDMDGEGEEFFEEASGLGKAAEICEVVGESGKTLESGGRLKIPVVFAADENYALPLIVAATSMLANKDADTFLEIYILHGDDLTARAKEKILAATGKYSGFSLSFINVGESYRKSENIPWGAASCYRLRLPGLLPEIKKCVYLDCDTLVLQDLREFFRIDVNDYYIAGVAHGSRALKEFKKYGREEIDNYANSGSLIMNLQKMREDGLENEFQKLYDINEKERKFSMLDQDVLNIACYEKILYIPLKFNMLEYLLHGDHIDFARKYFHADVLNEAINNPIIVHFAGFNMKPWNNLTGDFSKMWWFYAEKSGVVIDIISKFALSFSPEVRNLAAEAALSQISAQENGGA